MKQNFPFYSDLLYNEMIGYLSAQYRPKHTDEDSISELAATEFFRIREIICKKYRFDEDRYISKESDGSSPFDFVRDTIEREIYARIRKDDDQ